MTCTNEPAAWKDVAFAVGLAVYLFAVYWWFRVYIVRK